MTETCACQNCKQNFAIAPDDFDFYKKIDVPSPTFCPDCRNQRRMLWRNERSLYHRKCAATGKDVVTMFAPEQPIVVYERSYWWSDQWDQLASGRAYDFNKPFFRQFEELLHAAPLPNLANTNTVNSEYGNHNADVKNCYLVYASYMNEDLVYCRGAIGCRNSIDLYETARLENCYDNTLCGTLNSVFFSYDSDDSVNGAFFYACKNVSDSLACINVRNRLHYIFNKPYSKEEYQQERAKYDLGSYKELTKFRERYADFIKGHPRRHGFQLKCVNTVGDNLMGVKNGYMVFDVFNNVEDSKYLIHASGARDSYDAYGIGGNVNFAYEVIDTGHESNRTLFSVFTHASRDTYYTYACNGSQNLFGCVGLRNKRYCILNKQYTKEEYEKLVPKIIEHMNKMPHADAKGRKYGFGEFFPAEISPFAYNETIAYEYFPQTKEEVIAQGYRWREPDVRQYAVTLTSAQLPDHIKDVKDDILKEVIACEHGGTCNEQCTEAFKIIPSEFKFYRHNNLPLPRLCSNCRHFARLKLRTPFKLWPRVCQCAGAISQGGIYKNLAKHQHTGAACGKEILTSYAPGRAEIIYCDTCYQEEVV